MWGLTLTAVAVTLPVWAQPSTAPQDAPVESGNLAGDKIVEIRVEGNRRVEPEAIKRALVNKVGRSFDPNKTPDDLRALWKLRLFADIELLLQRLPKGGLVYVIRVTERPAVYEVGLEGNAELSNEDLKEQIDIKPLSILDLDIIRRNEKKIVSKYVEKGFFLAEVSHRIEKVPDSEDVRIVFVIRENSKVSVKEIRFIGAKEVSPSVLKSVMATKEGSFLSFLNGDGTYREELFQRDLAVIQSTYYDRGFINIKVEKPIVSISADKKHIFITLKLEEGVAFRIGKLDFAGDLLRDKSAYLELMASKSGEMFNRSKLSQDIVAITDLYSDEGFAYANINPRTEIHPEEQTIDLTFEMDKGKQVTIERIDVAGNTKTRDTVIRRELRVYEGELFKGSQIRRSKDRVTALGFFETVEVTHKPGSDDSKVVVRVEVKEKSTGTFQVGLGYSNVQSFILNGQVSQNNFFGWGTSFSLNGQYSSLQSFGQLSYFDPHFLDSNFIFNIDLFKMFAIYPDFTRDSTGGSLNWGYQLGSLTSSLEDVMLNMTYNLEYVKPLFGQVGLSTTAVQNYSLRRFFSEGMTSSLRLSATWDKRNNRLYPSSGFMLFGSAEYAPDFLGGSFLFSKYSGYGRYYLPLPLGIVFKMNATFGYIEELKGARPLPITELYYAGGINSLRGYLFRSVAPTILVPSSTQSDATFNDYLVGGNKQAIFNFELEFPIAQEAGFRGVLFYDAGNVYGRNESFFQDSRNQLPLGMFHSVGLGVRWFSPMGPLRFEWGFPLNIRPGRDEPFQFQFSIGPFF